MNENEILTQVKIALGICGDYQDSTLLLYINEAKEYIKGAGVSDTTLASKKAIGVICRGVADLWNYGAGDAKLSDYFIQRVTQLVLDEKAVKE